MTLSPEALLSRYGLDRVVNAIGYATPLGNCCPSSEVRDAMVAASQTYLRIDQLQQRASKVIANITGAQAGHVVNGASGGLVLAAAACMTGLDPVRMNRLPHTAGMPDEIVVHRAHRYDYDHAVRQAGAQLIEVGFPELTFAYDFEAALGPETAAVLYRADKPANVLPLSDVVRIAHANGVPVIVDAALTVPPVSSLRAHTDAGADLVVFSGGKAIEGPPASGFVAGREDLITAVRLQHLDMDVRVDTWMLRDLIDDGTVLGPPYQGIGRAMKVGKEQIVGLLVALEEYIARDHEADLGRWRDAVARIASSLDPLPAGIELVVDHGGRPEGYVPQLRLRFGERARASAVLRRMQEHDPPVFLNEGGLWCGDLVVVPTNLLPGDEAVLVEAIIGAAASVVGDGTKGTRA